MWWKNLVKIIWQLHFNKCRNVYQPPAGSFFAPPTPPLRSNVLYHTILLNPGELESQAKQETAWLDSGNNNLANYYAFVLLFWKLLQHNKSNSAKQ